ncbi:hypothetical protein QNO07_09690 [Streptomyces sp. 549]|uniref:hypothetical protein n=1 Tax=Streptomyces sp. 549 TaxID=3049076 RepID=UPI0024C21812|nr:hypothetical protein [Streptomyces sp. 549]MDK1473692.1 hypothetical protein [Streptomyces sp. 549]
MHLYNNAEAHFHLSTTDIDTRHACRITESPGCADILLHTDAATPALCASLNRWHHRILSRGLWAQRWDGPAGRLDTPPQHRRIATARWATAPATLTAGEACRPVERQAGILWLIRDGEATDALIDQMNRRLERLVGDGLWIQRWHGRRRTPQPASTTRSP